MPNTSKDPQLTRTDDEWRALLTPEQYAVLRQKDTERPFSGEFVDTSEAGTYLCAGCGQELFEAEAKFDAGCGWPSFSAQKTPEAVTTESDSTLRMPRTEILCSRCGGHLGHVFDDGPRPTGLRYCVNSLSLKFAPK